METRLAHIVPHVALGVAAVWSCATLSAAPAVLVVGKQRSGHPNTHESLQQALDAARPGDTIVCRPGVHPLPLEVTVGVRIVGEPGAMLDPAGGFLRVHHLPAGQRFLLAGFGVVDGLELRAQLHDNRGAVHLTDVAVGNGQNPRTRGPSVWIRDCAEVTLERLSTYGVPAVDAARTDRLLVTDCTLLGRYSWQGRRNGPAVKAAATRLAIAGGLLRGSDDPTGQLVAPAVELSDATLWLTGAAELHGGTAHGSRFQAAVHAPHPSSLVLGDSVLLNPGSRPRGVLTGMLTIERRETVALRAEWVAPAAGLAAQLRIGATGPASTNVVLLAALPGAPLSFPGAPLGVWLAPATTVAFGGLATDANGRGRFELDAPTRVDAGDLFVVQGITWQARGVEPSLPAIYWVVADRSQPTGS